MTHLDEIRDRKQIEDNPDSPCGWTHNAALEIQGRHMANIQDKASFDYEDDSCHLIWRHSRQLREDRDHLLTIIDGMAKDIRFLSRRCTCLDEPCTNKQHQRLKELGVEMLERYGLEKK